MNSERLVVENLKARAKMFSLKFEPCWVCEGEKPSGPTTRQRVKRECPLCGGEGIIPRSFGKKR